MYYQINCPECGSFNVKIYEKDLNPFLQEHYYICNACGNIWKETIKTMPDLNTYKREQLNKKIEMLKQERLQYIKWGKIKIDDIINCLIDLFEMGSNKFSKHKKRNIKNGENKRNNISR